MIRSSAQFATFHRLMGHAGGRLPWFVRGVLVVWAIMFLLMALVLGLFAGVALLVWRVLSGSRPFLNPRGVWRSHVSPRSGVGSRSHVVPDVIEGEVREVDAVRRDLDR